MNNAVINFLFNSQSALKEIDTFKSNFSKTMDALSNSSLAKLGRIGTALGSVFSVKKFIDHTKAVRDLNDVYKNLPLEEISLFTNKIKLLGGSENEAIGFMEKMQNALTQFNTGQGGVLSNVMNALGINVGDVKNATDLIDKIHEGLSSGKISETGFSKIISDLGASPVIARYMSKSKDEMAELNKKAEQMGIVGAEEVQMLNKWQESVALLEGAFDRFGRTIARNVTPVIEKLTGAMDWFLQQDETTQNWILGIAMAFMFLSPAVREVKVITNAVRGLIGVISSLGSMAKNVISSPAGIISLVGLMMKAVNDDFLGIRTSMQELSDDFRKFLDGFSQDHPILGGWLKQIQEMLEDMTHPFEMLSTAWSNLKHMFKGEWDKVVDLDEVRKKARGDFLTKNKDTASFGENVKTGISKVTNSPLANAIKNNNFNINNLSVIANNPKEFATALQEQVGNTNNLSLQY